MRTFLLLAGLIAFLVLGMNIQSAEPMPFGAPPMPPVAPVASPPPQAGEVQPVPGFHQPTEAQKTERILPAEAAAEKAGPKFAAPGDDELRKLQIAKYNAAFEKMKSIDAAYQNGTVTFDLLLEAQQRLLQVEYELSDKPADQIAALEGALEAAKSLEAKVKALYYSKSHGGEADKYYRAKYMRLDAEIQLLRAKRKFGFAK